MKNFRLEFFGQKWVSKFFNGYFWGFCFWPFIWYRDNKPDKIMKKHEREHHKQQIRGLLIGYYIRYWIELFWNRFIKKMNWVDAYRNISYEKKARDAEYK